MRRAQRDEIEYGTPGFRVFPDPADVFVADQPELARHLHPLVSIDLSLVDDGWRGWIHVVSPLEPHEVTLGYATTEWHSPLQRENWLGLAMEGDRYRLTGDLRYFARATSPAELPDPWPRFRAELEEHCQAEEASYQANRDAFRGGQHSPHMVIIDRLGGQPDEGNWYARGAAAVPFPVEYDDAGIWPMSPSGNRFWFVAEVPGWRYRRRGADSILLFFEPVERVALLTFDWT
jgi:hypothetical protein